MRSHFAAVSARSQSRSQSFVPLDQRSENESSGSNHYERTKEITEFWLSGSLRICIYGACLKWLLPELSFSDRWSRGTKLWERDWRAQSSSYACETTGFHPDVFFVTRRYFFPYDRFTGYKKSNQNQSGRALPFAFALTCYKIYFLQLIYTLSFL